MEPDAASPSAGRTALDPLLRARSVAVVGASATPGTFGHALLRQLLDSGYVGTIYPVNPGRNEIDGVRCYPSLADLPVIVDCAALAVGDERLEGALLAAAAARVPAAVIFGAAPVPGAAEPLPARLRRIALDAGMVVLGGNCMGFYNVRDQLFVSGYPLREHAAPGGIAFVSHSGSAFSAVAHGGRGLGYSYLISPGQELVLTVADYLYFLLGQPETRVVGLFLETVRDPVRFVAALEEAARREIPVVALKVGRSAGGRAMALAHSGALAGSDEAFTALCDRWGVIQVRSLDELGDVLELLAAPRRPRGGGLALAGDSGGERALIVDRAAELGVPWARLSSNTLATMATVLEPGLEPANPLDVWGSGREWQRVYETCLTAMALDPATGLTVLAVDLVPGSRLAPDYTDILRRVHEATGKPVAALGNMSTTIDRALAARLRAGGVPVLMGTESALRAIAHTLSWTPAASRDVMGDEDPMRSARWRGVLAKHEAPLDEVAAKALLADWGIPVVGEHLAETEAACLAAARELGWPVVVKTAAPGVLHKSDAGGVMLGLSSDQTTRAAYQSLAARFGPRVVVQRQVSHVDAVELFVGMSVDPWFGPLVSFGLGGIWVETLRDVAVVLPPIDARTAERQLRQLRAAPLLLGARGRPPVDLSAVAATIAAFSRMAVALGPALIEVDVNPLLAGPEGVIAVDALVVPRCPPPLDGHP